MSIEELADRLGPLDEIRNTSPARSFTLGVWRALHNHGVPLDSPALDQIATDAGLSQEQAATITSRYGELNEAGAMVGLSGLSIADHPHSIQFEDRVLSSWCAWDPFFLVPILGGSAIVSSTDPQTGTAVRLTFEDGRVTEATPAGTLISIVVPSPHDDDSPASTVEELWATF